MYLGREMILHTEDGYPRDWRGIFQLSGLARKYYEDVEKSDQKITLIIGLLKTKSLDDGSKLTMQQFLHCLGQIDRYDVYDDIQADFSKTKILLINQKF